MMNHCYLGDCRDVMRQLIADGVKVQTIVTSPPYFGLRDYGVAGQIGLEATMQEYIANMVEVFDVARELLADDGTLWLNLGDSYANDGKWGGSTGGKHVTALHGTNVGRGKRNSGLKPKDLCGIPWRVAFALQEAGWYLRQDIIWAKPNPMPESVRDRCTKSHEYLFLLAKSERYYFDADAIKEDCVQDESRPTFRGGAYCNNSTFDNAEGGKSTDTGNVRRSWNGSEFHTGKTAEHQLGRSQKVRSPAGWKTGPGSHGSIHDQGREQEVTYTEIDASKRNKRSVWTIATQPFKEAHFATFPPALIEPCILAGSKPGDIIFDPFMGSGTVGQVAQQLGRRWLGAELNQEYIELQKKRTQQAGMVFA